MHYLCYVESEGENSANETVRGTYSLAPYGQALSTYLSLRSPMELRGCWFAILRFEEINPIDMNIYVHPH